MLLYHYIISKVTSVVVYEHFSIINYIMEWVFTVYLADGVFEEDSNFTSSEISL